MLDGYDTDRPHGGAGRPLNHLFSPGELLDWWEGHRRLTLRTIEAFPEEALFQFSPAKPLRSFGSMVTEIISLEAAYVRGIAEGRWSFAEIGPDGNGPDAKTDLLKACLTVREDTRWLWEKIDAAALHQVVSDGLFDPAPKRNLDRVLYAIENEIHHRGQGYIYLRMLGISPPPFYER